MLTDAIAVAVRRRYDEIANKRHKPTTVITTEFPDVGIFCRKRYQTVHPELGLTNACNETFTPLTKFCVQYRDYNESSPKTSALKITPTLSAAIDAVKFQPCTPEQLEYRSKMNAFSDLYRDPEFVQIVNFLQDFENWIATGRDENCPSERRNKIYLEPFQRNLLAHVLFFLATTKNPTLANRVTEYLTHAFDLHFLSSQSIDLFKQKATVFLVPRRHGKTWFTIPVICFLLKNIIGISIGYVAHQKHVSQYVLKEVEFRCKRMFSGRFMVENKDNVISVDHKIAKSTALFASCYNTNVTLFLTQSIRGQNFNLLIVDEAHFIKKEAFNTILGFLAQNTTKIIFISSTNTTSDSTCFLTKLTSAPFDMLNVVSYVCEEHIQAFSEKGDATACPCYRLHKPTFITLNSDVRKTANMFMPGSFMDEIMGGTNKINEETVLITDESREEFDLFRYSTTNPQFHPHLGAILSVYVDPAFTSNRRASGTGVAAVGTYRDQFIVYGLEHYFLKDLLDSSETSIADCVSHMLLSILRLHPFLSQVRVTIEGNSNQAAAVRIACNIKHNLLSAHAETLFYHSPDQNEIQQPFYLMNRDKRLAVEDFIAKFNSSYIKASQELISHTIKLSYDPVEYLLDQLRHIQRITLNEYVTYSAKRNNQSDDLVVALIMAVYMCSPERSFNFKPI
ncbi:M89 protein [Murid betaherpesvirus 1]|nr:M89 protein [Murid betaherpesvirus 1]